MRKAAKGSSDETATVAKSGAKPKERVRTKQKVNSQRNLRKKTSDKSETSKYGNAVEFKRLDLMKSLVDRLEDLRDKDVISPSYSVSAFTKDYMQVQKMSESGQETKKSTYSLRTDYQEFTGAAVNVAITEGVKEFSEGTVGKKTMIVLTDGANDR